MATFKNNNVVLGLSIFGCSIIHLLNAVCSPAHFISLWFLALIDLFIFFTELTVYKRNDQNCRQGDLEYWTRIYRYCSSITGHVRIGVLSSGISVLPFMDRRFCFIQSLQHLHLAIHIVCGLLYTLSLLYGYCYITWRYGGI